MTQTATKPRVGGRLSGLGPGLVGWLAVLVSVLASCTTSSSPGPGHQRTASTTTASASASVKPLVGKPSSGDRPATRPVPASPVPAVAIDFCRDCAAPLRRGVPANTSIVEASGLAASQAHRGAYYVHNDSGDTARFFALDLDGTDLGTYELGDVRAVDWEDSAIGPCPAGSCLYLGDFGDNLRIRTDYTVYRVAEPPRLRPGRHAVRAERLPYQYPYGCHDAETLLVHPLTGELYVITKVPAGRSSIYRFPMPLRPDERVTLDKVGEVTQVGTFITAGDIHPRGAGVMLRTYTHLLFAPLRTTNVAVGLEGALCRVPSGWELQGEAVAWTSSGDGFVTLAEGASPALRFTACEAP